VIETKKKLNKEQKEAVQHVSGPLLIVAGAGTGKTSVLIERLDYLINEKDIKIDDILLITFTEKAAAEMEERADKVLPYGYVDLWINTFHGFCQRLLKEHSLDIGLPGDFRLITQTDQWVLIKKNLEKLKLEYYKPLGNPTKFIHELIKHFSRLKDEDISDIDYLEYVEKLEKETDEKDEEAILEIERIKELAQAYKIYNKILLDEGLLDFGDLIMYTLKLFRKRPNILKHYRDKFKQIMVDEFQDTNWAQYELIKLLSAPKNNLMVVGDDDQAVYKFRGASLSNIMQFKDDFPKAKEVVLVENYRSGQNILDKSYSFIKHNDPNRLEAKLKINKKLNSNVSGKGSVEHLHFPSDIDEVKGVVTEIKNIFQNEKDVAWSDFAILVRANDTALKFISELSRNGMPNQFVSLRGLYYKPVIMDILAYFKLLDNYHESSALFRVLNMDIFKVNYHDLVTINKFARRKVLSTYEAIKQVSSIKDVSDESVKNINKLLELIDTNTKSARYDRASKVFLDFARGSGLVTHYDFDRDQEIYDHLNQLYRKIKDYEAGDPDFKVRDFVEAVELEMEAGETGSLSQNFDDNDKIKVMTAHASKGLEFDYVFIVNLVDKKFPTIGKKDKIMIPDGIVKEKLPEGDVHIEEERRLFYVSLTRARKKLFLTSASDYGGAQNKKISKFLNELGFEVDFVKKDKEKKAKRNDLWDDLFAKKISQEEKNSKYELPKRFSFSQIAAYTNCPYQYRFNFILKIPVDDKQSFIFGRIMHDTLKDLFLPLTDPISTQPALFEESEDKKTKISKKELFSLFDKNWRDDGYRSKKDREKYHEKGMEILDTLYEDMERESWPKPAFIEKSFNLKMGGYILKGAIDRIDHLDNGTVEIIDYKTGSPKDKLVFDDKRQLLLYKIAAEEALGLKVAKLSFYYLENNSKIRFEAKDKDIEKLQTIIIDTIDEIKQSSFPPKPGMLCSWCDFNNICEFRKK